MGDRKDFTEVLDSLESEYSKDLSLHLYSTRLARRVDPYYPNKHWAAWPLHIDEVPLPKTSLKYVDCAIEKDYYEHDADIDYKGVIRDKYGKQHEKHESKKHEQAESDDENEHEVENHELELGKDATVLEFKLPNGHFKPISTVKYIERKTNLKEDLVNEIHATLQRRIATRFQQMKTRPKYKLHELSPDMQTEETVNLSKNIARKVDALLNDVVEKFGGLDDSNPNKGDPMIGWQHILLSGLSTVDTPYTTFEPSLYSELYNRCESLMDNIHYRYEVDEENEESSNAGFDESGRFDVVAYLRSNYDEQKAEAHLQKRHEYLDYSYNLRKIFERRLALHDRTEELRWDGGVKKKARGLYGIKAKDWDELRRNAIRHGPTDIEPKMYLLKDY